MWRIFHYLISSLLVFLFVGCASMSTNTSYFNIATQKVYNGNYEAAIQTVKDGKETIYKRKDRVMYYLDLGMLQHYSGSYDDSNYSLTSAERSIEENFTKSISQEALSFVTNDNIKDYSGEDYEDIYLNLFKALNFANLKQIEDAFVEIHRVNHKLNKLEDKYADLSKRLNSSKDAKLKVTSTESKFHNSALARYISMLLYRNDRKWDDARIDANKFAEAWKYQPEVYDFSQPDISASLDESIDGRLNILCFSGKSPEKTSKTWWIRTFNDYLFIAHSREELNGNNQLDQFISFYYPDITDNLFFKFEVPEIRSRPTKINSIEILIDGKLYKPELIENFDNVATQTFELKKNIIYIKTIVRTVTKGILAKKTKDKMNNQFAENPLLGALAGIATDAALSATENADQRISHFFPKLAHIAEIPLPLGLHSVKINYLDKYGNLLFSDDHGNVHVASNELNLVESFCLQ